MPGAAAVASRASPGSATPPPTAARALRLLNRATELACEIAEGNVAHLKPPGSGRIRTRRGGRGNGPRVSESEAERLRKGGFGALVSGSAITLNSPIALWITNNLIRYCKRLDAARPLPHAFD
jgi:hypothetical protein